MKRNSFFILISSIALVLVLIIQVSWIFQTAKVKAELFNEKANMVLARTTEALLADKETCSNIEKGSTQHEFRKIDSLFNYYMKFYGFNVDYSFEIVRPGNFTTGKFGDFTFASNQPKVNEQACFEKELEQIADNSGWKLKLNLPEKRQFIMAEMGTLFVTSLLLVFFVLLLFWRTTLSLITEKKISEHTTDFLNNMTHEFKTPLANIGLAGKMMVRDSNITDVDKVKHYSGIILEENEKLKQQVDHVLSMTALERGEIPLQKTLLDFHELIQDALSRMNMQLISTNGSVELDFTAVKHTLSGDRNHLSNALCNLIDNAIK